MGQIGILNVGAGDTKLVFDPSKPDDMARAARTIADMISRGYVILIEAGKDDKGETLYKRVQKFSEETCEYIIAGDADVHAPESEQGVDHEQSSNAPAPRKRRAQAPPLRVHASKASGIAVARTAGG